MMSCVVSLPLLFGLPLAALFLALRCSSTHGQVPSWHTNAAREDWPLLEARPGAPAELRWFHARRLAETPEAVRQERDMLRSRVKQLEAQVNRSSRASQLAGTEAANFAVASQAESDSEIMDTVDVKEIYQENTGIVRVATAVFISLCVLSQLSCCVYCSCVSTRSLLKDVGGCIQRGDFLYSQLPESRMDEMEVVGAMLQREMRLKVFTPFLLPLLTFPWTDCHHGSPLWGYMAFLPLIARSKYIEVGILQKVSKKGWRAMLSISFVLGLVDHLDWFTDGLFPIQAFRCDMYATPYFLESLSQSLLWPLEYVVSIIRFWGVAALTLSTSVLALQAFGTMGEGIAGLASAADVACFGAVAQHYEHLIPEEDKGLSQVVTTLLKVLLKNTVQLWFQASFFGLMFGKLSTWGKAKILFMMCVGIVGAISKTRLAAQVNCKQICRAWSSGRKDLAGIVVMIIAAQLASLVMVGWVVLKLYKSFTCPTHLWNVSSGCVEHLSQERAF
mmetsp:Transcript_62457/g.140820  ORF Transcript_62457/g.140820 Transcript_62457/m.140820 type:complete len:503 (+) Transcript_62457:57-1565(+)